MKVVIAQTAVRIQTRHPFFDQPINDSPQFIVIDPARLVIGGDVGNKDAPDWLFLAHVSDTTILAAGESTPHAGWR